MRAQAEELKLRVCVAWCLCTSMLAVLAFAPQDMDAANACWEQASEALVQLCKRCIGSRQARVLQTAHILLSVGLEGSALGNARLQSSNSPADACQPPVQLPEDRGVMKLINLLAPLCCQNSKVSVERLQTMSSCVCADDAEELEKLVGSMVACTRFVADSCSSVLISPEEFKVARCRSLHIVVPLLEGCVPTLDSALTLSSVARKLQVPTRKYL